MRRLLSALFCLILPVLPAAAQDKTELFTIGGDHYLAGEVVTHDQPGAEDLFMAGDIVTDAAPIAGSAHIAGRRIKVTAGIGGNAYAAGMDLTIGGPVTGNASLTGYSVRLTAPVGGNLRAAASEVTLDAPVAGYAMLAGDTVTLNAAVTGDAVVSARKLDFGPAARVGGELTVYAEPGDAPQVPDSVAPADRVHLKTLDERPGEFPSVFSWRNMLWRFVQGVIVVSLIAAALAAVAPKRLAALRRRILAAPFRSLWFGFLAQSVAIGATVLLAMTLIGLLLAPAALVVALVGGFIGYVIAAYALGVGVMLAAGRPEPASIGPRALAALIGALLAGAIALIPFLGWLFVLAAVLAGLGALAQELFRPAFFAEPGHS